MLKQRVIQGAIVNCQLASEFVRNVGKNSFTVGNAYTFNSEC